MSEEVEGVEEYLGFNQRISKLEKEIRNLKAANTRLRKRIEEGTEIMVFQQQIDSFNTEIKALRQNILDAQRFSAHHFMRTYINNILDKLATSSSPDVKHCIDAVRNRYVEVRTALQHSDDPSSLAQQTMDDISKYLREQGLLLFIEEINP